MSENYIPDSVCIMTPVYGAVNFRFFESLTLLLTKGIGKRRIVFKGIYGDSLVSRARNIGTAMFLEPGGIKSEEVTESPDIMMPRCEWLLFVDSDLSFFPEDIEKLLNSGKKVIGGLYAKKRLGGSWVLNTLNKEDIMPETGLFKIRYIGTGFMLVHRSVFEQVIEGYPGIAYEDDADYSRFNWHRHRWDFWPVGVKSYIDENGKKRKRYLSEDWYFCERLQELGIEVWVDTEVRLMHFGEIGYPITPFIDGCSMYEVNKIMKDCIERRELQTADALQDTLDKALKDKELLGKESAKLEEVALH